MAWETGSRETGSLVRLVLGEALPAVLAAVAAGLACAAALPTLTAPVLNLAVFTGSATPVPLAPDLAIPAAGLALLSRSRWRRRRGCYAIVTCPACCGSAADGAGQGLAHAVAKCAD